MTKRKENKWIWMPHPAHFIGADSCKFRLATYVGGYIVSTVGEYMPSFKEGTGEFEELGYNRKYETMVFKARKSSKEVKCCPYEIIVEEEMDMAGYNDPEDAVKGHMKLCKKWGDK